MKKRVALVTGGTRGIGAAISEALKNAGYMVAAGYASNQMAAKEFSEKTRITAYQFNVADYNECQKVVTKISQDMGPIDILVNNAGITRDAPLHRLTPQQWQEVIDTNLTSCFNMCRVLIDGMRERGFGRIVNIGSINGQA
ncbi:MAG TPA: SDR family NAD(P)-dependent oxidoreductase, partial [Alphaproteobacteria bacterium]|nr:SDR family NAD(P)-dependent oxidoreductase [Alphaproteobacteria bacterium]